jgi:hypothetical protein
MKSQRAILANYSCWLGPTLAIAAGWAVLAAWQWPAWVFMWVLAFVIFAGFKYLTYCEALAGGPMVPRLTRCLYLFCWPGMSLEEFARATAAPPPANSLLDWIAAAVKTLVGAGLVWAVVPAVPVDAWLLRGWVGMVGIIMMLHFGTFLLAEHLASGTPLARAVCGFLALFWSVRFVAGTFVFDLSPYLTNRWRRAGLAAANLVFACLPVIYGWVALKGVGP